MTKKKAKDDDRIDAAHGQIQGARTDQEDSVRLDRFGDREVLASVADGLGGHPAGDVASREALAAFHAHVAKLREKGEGEIHHWMEDATQRADAHLRDLQDKDFSLDGMATTLVSVYVKGHRLTVISVGDSFVFLMQGGQLTRLNDLHSEGGGVTSCVGYNLSRIELLEGEVASGDRLLLASDGILTLNEDEVAEMMRDAKDAKSAVTRLLDAVTEAGIPHQDNTTVVALFL